MSIKKIHIFFLFYATTAFGQFVPNYYATLESNRPKGNKYLYYRLYSTSTSAFPATAAEFETNFATAANFKLAGYVALTSNSGNLNSSSSYTSNLINFLNQTDLKNAIGNQSPYSGFGGDGFTIVVSGYFIPKQTGTYTFSIEGDDAVDLFINDQNVVNHYGAHGPGAIGTHTGTIALIAGKKYVFRARMQEGGGGEVMQLFWKKPSEASSSVWYQDIEELSGEEVVPNGLVFNLDPSNWFSYPKSGTSAYDISANKYQTTLTNGVGFNGNDGKGVFTFDGVDDYILTGQSMASEQFTIGGWIKSSNSSSSFRMILGKEPSDAYAWNYRIYLNITDGYLVGDIRSDGSMKQIIYPVNMADGTWRYVLFSRDTATGTFNLYVNGVLVKSVSDTSTGTLSQSQIVWIGRSPYLGGSYPFIGSIGNVSIYNRALTADEVFQNFNATKTKYGL